MWTVFGQNCKRSHSWLGTGVPKPIELCSRGWWVQNSQVHYNTRILQVDNLTYTVIYLSSIRCIKGMTISSLFMIKVAQDMRLDIKMRFDQISWIKPFKLLALVSYPSPGKINSCFPTKYISGPKFFLWNRVSFWRQTCHNFPAIMQSVVHRV